MHVVVATFLLLAAMAATTARVLVVTSTSSSSSSSSTAAAAVYSLGDDAAPPPPYYPLKTHVLVISIGTEHDEYLTNATRQFFGVRDDDDDGGDVVGGDDIADASSQQQQLQPPNEKDDPMVRLSPGVNAYNWPAKIEDAVYATKDIQAELVLAGSDLREVYYANALTQSQDSEGGGR